MLQIASDTSLIGQIRRVIQAAKRREPDVLVLLRNAYALGQEILPNKSSKYSKDEGRYPPAQLLAMYVLKIYRDLSYRETEEEFKTSGEKREAVGMTRVPDHTTLHGFFKGLAPETIERAQRLTAQSDPWENRSVKVSAELFPELLRQKLDARDSAAAEQTRLDFRTPPQAGTTPSGPGNRSRNSSSSRSTGRFRRRRYSRRWWTEVPARITWSLKP